MADDIYGLSGEDVDRIRRMLEEFEGVRLRQAETQRSTYSPSNRIEQYLARVTAEISAASTVSTTLTTLDGAINSSVTSLVVHSVTGMPTDREFIITIGTEQILVTVVETASLTLTIVRGWNGTTAASHADAANVVLAVFTLGEGSVTIVQAVEDSTGNYVLMNGTESLTTIDDPDGFTAYNVSTLAIPVDAIVELRREPFSGLLLANLTSQADVPKTHICLTNCDSVQYCVAIPTADIVLGDCVDNGSGGGGEFVPTDCDCSPTSSMLCATISGTSGDLTCLEGETFDIVYDSGSNSWYACRTDLSCGDSPDSLPYDIAMGLYCLDVAGVPTWSVLVSFASGACDGVSYIRFSAPMTAADCDPLHLTGTLGNAIGGTGAGTVDIVIGPCGSTGGITITDLGNNATSTTPTTTLSLTGKTVTQACVLNVALLDASSHTATATFNGSPMVIVNDFLLTGAGRILTFAPTGIGTGDFVVTVAGGLSSVILMSAVAVDDLDNDGIDAVGGSSGSASVPDTGATPTTIYPKEYAHAAFLTEDSGTITWTNGFTAGSSNPTITLAGKIYYLSYGYKVLSAYQTVDAALTNSAVKWAGGVLTLS